MNAADTLTLNPVQPHCCTCRRPSADRYGVCPETARRLPVGWWYCRACYEQAVARAQREDAGRHG